MRFSVVPEDYRKPTGFSLVELMVAIVIGLVVVGGVISIFASAVKSHTDNLRMTRLNEDLRVTMNLMTRELRRAGFWGGDKDGAGAGEGEGILGTLATLAGAGAANDFLGPTIAPAGNCITFSYDEDNDGTLDAGETRGFGLDGSAVEVPSAGAACGGGMWTNITDPDAIEITALTFTLLPNSTVDIDGVTSGGGAVPCTPTTPVALCPAGANSYVPPALQNVPVNEIEITLTGHLTGDASVSRTIRETVRVYQ